MSDEPSCCNQDQKPIKRRYKAWLRDSTTNIPKSTLEYRSMIEIAEKVKLHFFVIQNLFFS